MPYATPADLQARYSERELRLISDERAQSVNVPRLQTALDDASKEMDTFIGCRHTLPVVWQDGYGQDADLIRICCDIAVYRLQTLRPADDVKDARQRYEDALRWLKMVCEGKIELAGAQTKANAAPSPIGNHSPGEVLWLSTPQIFNRENSWRKPYGCC